MVSRSLSGFGHAGLGVLHSHGALGVELAQPDSRTLEARVKKTRDEKWQDHLMAWAGRFPPSHG
jgi:hypothetical protein